MKERPILMNGPMVRAVLAGTKTQTRRIVKPQPVLHVDGGGWYPHGDAKRRKHYGSLEHFMRGLPLDFCPYGQPGDRLYVKEAHQFAFRYRNIWCRYAADGHFCAVPAPHIPTSVARRRPSIHMPRWASRLTLEITEVRVERLNEISVADCWAEGIEPGAVPAKQQYQRLWESINGPGSWAANPWVWVISFRRLP